jgi:outer membrane protein assembly factor BamB
MRRALFCPFASALLFLLLAAGEVSAGNWPQWRGPCGNSVSDETNLPVKWNQQSGIVWTCALPQFGASTPAIWGDAIFLTAHQGEKLLLLKINKTNGKIEWTREVGSGTVARGKPQRGHQVFHDFHNMASPSPVTDGERVIAHFGNGDLAAYDFTGKQLWIHDLQKEHGTYTIWWGHGNSPVLWKDLVISVCMQDSLADLQQEPAQSYLVAHDKRTGEQKWKTPRMTGAQAEDCDAYTTPVFHQAKDHVEMIVMGGRHLDAYDPATGRQLWVFSEVNGSRTITGPTLGQDMVYATAGKRGALLAVRLGGKGRLTEKSLAWQQAQSTPDSPSPVLWKDLLFWVTDEGIARCHDAKTGELKWSERLSGRYKASPLAAEDRIYFLNMSGKCTVVSASARFEKRAENQVDDDTTASPGVSDGRIYLRGKKALYCIGSE